MLEGGERKLSNGRNKERLAEDWYIPLSWKEEEKKKKNLPEKEGEKKNFSGNR